MEEELQLYKGQPTLVSMLEVQKERNRFRGSKFTFNLPDELAEKMKKEFMRSKKIADAKAEKERIE